MSVCVGVASTFVYFSWRVGALSVRNHWGSYGHVFILVVEEISLMIPGAYTSKVDGTEKKCYNRT